MNIPFLGKTVRTMSEVIADLTAEARNIAAEQELIAAEQMAIAEEAERKAREALVEKTKADAFIGNVESLLR